MWSRSARAPRSPKLSGVVRGTAEDDPNLVIIPGLVPLLNKETGEIEYVVAHAEWDRLDAMTPVSI